MGRSSRRQRRRRQQVKVGLPPGSAVFTGEAREGAVGITLISYGPESAERVDSASRERLTRAFEERDIAWVDLDGLHETKRVQKVAEAFELHPLWIEDILNPSGRPKVEQLGNQLLVVLRVLRPDEGGGVDIEQVSVVLGPAWVLSFQERPGDLWDPVRERILEGKGRIRARGADYLFHALIDAVVDHYFVVLDELELGVDRLEDAALDPRIRDVPARFADLKGDVAAVRQAVSPLRETTATLLRSEESLLRPETVPFYRDLQDHVLSVAEATETLRDRMLGALELDLAVAGNQLNEIMRVLTVVSTIFIPLSFLAGLYGMNFVWMPELNQPWGYPLLVALMASVAGVMLTWFRRRGWL